MKSIIFIFLLLTSSTLFAQSGAMSVQDFTDSLNGTRTPPVTRRDMEVMTPADRVAVRGELNRVDGEYDRFLTTHCTTRRDGSQVLDESCGRVDVRVGDPNFQPERINSRYKTSQYARVPKNGKVEVHTQCESDGKFYTKVTVDGKPFTNPYNGQTKWLTSPGQYNRRDVAAGSSEGASYRTNLPVSRNSSSGIPASGYITQWHIVSDAKSYAGAEMPFSVWLNNSGYAYHAGTAARPVDGYPASAGCFRMDEDNAKGLFNLTRRVGTNNMKFYWHGYRNAQGRLCTRPDNVPNAIASDINTTNSANSRRNIFQRIGDWFRGNTNSRTRSTETTNEPVSR